MSDPVSYLQAMDDAACRSCETRKRLEAELQPFLEQEAQEIASHEAIMKDRGLTECTTFGPAAIQRMAEQQERRKHDPDFVLPLSEYKAFQARTVAAELALAGLKEYAGKTFDLWDKDQESKVGKRLMWMSGKGNRNYEPDLEHIHTVSAEAVQGLIEKAAMVDKIIADEQEIAVNSQAEADTLRTRLAESEALVERLSRALANLENDNMSIPDTIWEECLLAKRLTPADAIAGYRDEVRNEAVEAMAKLAEAEADVYAFPDQGVPTRSECFRIFANKMRSIKKELR